MLQKYWQFALIDFYYPFFFSRWRFEALKNRCIIMNRELLLENNNIAFDAKLPNVRQMVDRHFDPEEGPIIDDELTYKNDSFKQNFSMLNGDSMRQHSVGSFSDVREIFHDLNYHTTDSSFSNTSNENRDENTIVLMPKEVPIVLESFQPLTTLNTIAKSEKQKTPVKSTPPLIEPTIKGEKTTTPVKTIENKENVDSNDPNEAKNKIDTSFQFLSEKNVTETSRSSITNSENIQQISMNDSQDRVKQVNVEMFTVSFKKRV